MAGRKDDLLQIKLLTIGDSAVGKTCLLLQYSAATFQKTFITTIGIDFKTKVRAPPPPSRRPSRARRDRCSNPAPPHTHTKPTPHSPRLAIAPTPPPPRRST